MSLQKLERFSHSCHARASGEIFALGPEIMHTCMAIHGENWGSKHLLVDGSLQEVITSPLLCRGKIYGQFDSEIDNVRIDSNFKLLAGDINIVYKHFRWGEGHMSRINYAALRMFIVDRLTSTHGYVGGDTFWIWEINSDELVLFSLALDEEAVLKKGEWQLGKLTCMKGDNLEKFMRRLASLSSREGSGEKITLWCPAEEEEERTNAAGGAGKKHQQPGGLSKEVKEQIELLCGILRIPGQKRKELGIELSRGWILHGPPGTGKTMLASYLTSIIPNSKLHIVRGPELLSCWVGKSEEAIRELFAEAEEEWEEKGWESELHIILIDEIDALLHRREGSDLTNNVVTQFLSVIDGTKKIGNIFVIGTTNRLESIDPAVRRSGRLDQCMHIGYLSSREDIREAISVHLDHECGLGEWLTDLLVGERDAIGRITGADIAKIIRNAKYAALKRLEYDVSAFMLQREDFKV